VPPLPSYKRFALRGIGYATGQFGKNHLATRTNSCRPNRPLITPREAVPRSKACTTARCPPWSGPTRPDRCDIFSNNPATSAETGERARATLRAFCRPAGAPPTWAGGCFAAP